MATVTFTTTTGTVTFSSTVSVIAGSCSGYPAVGDVETGVVFGNASEYTGTFDVPAEGDVRSGTGYGEDGTEFTGSLTLITPSGIAYQRPPLTGQTPSYANYDDGWNLANNIYDYTPPANPIYLAELDHDNATPANAFITLKNNNAFGNTARFTDDSGGQTYSNSYLIDHLTGLGWYYVSSAINWATYLTNVNTATDLTFSDWYCPSANQIRSIVRHTPSKPTDSTPMSTLGVLVNSAVGTGTTDPFATANIIIFSTNRAYFSTQAKTTSSSALMVRNHYV